MRAIILSTVLFVTCSFGAKDCKLTIRTLDNKGTSRVEVIEIEATSASDCKQQAREREKQARLNNVQNVRITSSWSGPRD